MMNYIQTNPEDILDRNIRAWGEKTQEKISDLHVLVTGSGPLSQMFSTALFGFGVNKITLMGNERISLEDLNEFLCLKNGDFRPKSKVESMEGILKQINPKVNIQTYRSKLNSFFIDENNKPNLIVDTTNSVMSKISSLNLSEKYNIPFFSASSDENKGTAIYYPPHSSLDIKLECLLNEFNGSYQGNATSGVIAGVLSSELIRFADPELESRFNGEHLNSEKEGDDNLFRVDYNLYSSKRWSNNELIEYVDYSINSYSDKKVLLIGAGALGNFVGLNLALMGVGKVTIMDDDKIKDHNLNRQILFYGRVGGYKAEVLAERLKEITPGIEIEYFIKKFNEKSINTNIINLKDYDLIFSCVHDFTVRGLIDKYAVQSKVPLINGQTWAFGGEMQVFWPGVSKSINEQINLDFLIQQEAEKKKKENAEEAGCIDDPNPSPSIITPNLIIGSAMVGEAKVIFKEHKKNSLKGRLFYRYPRTFGLKKPIYENEF